jgi:hypothetical protein
MSRTKSDLAEEVMRLLGLLDANESPSTEDSSLIENAYDDKWEELRLHERIYWKKDEIPNEVFRAMARIVAEDVAPSFGVQTQPEFGEGGQQVSMGTKGLFDLKRVMAREASGVPTKATYF